MPASDCADAAISCAEADVCCVDADCAPLGSVYRCLNNSCTGCAAATGNKYYVDPLNGSDATSIPSPSTSSRRGADPGRSGGNSTFTSVTTPCSRRVGWMTR